VDVNYEMNAFNKTAVDLNVSPINKPSIVREDPHNYVIRK